MLSLCCDILFVLTTAAAPWGGLLMITIVKTLMTEEQQMTQEVCEVKHSPVF